ncbi:hypothetical protein SK128_015590 [Halocaridina rubra]|uniref:Uncharacterized protein n=1 Tax=Halocaridina rubra TaxID=373956 RepID=A0AAN8XK86_HALRR
MEEGMCRENVKREECERGQGVSGNIFQYRPKRGRTKGGHIETEHKNAAVDTTDDFATEDEEVLALPKAATSGLGNEETVKLAPPLHFQVAREALAGQNTPLDFFGLNVNAIIP